MSFSRSDSGRVVGSSEGTCDESFLNMVTRIASSISWITGSLSPYSLHREKDLPISLPQPSTSFASLKNLAMIGLRGFERPDRAFSIERPRWSHVAFNWGASANPSATVWPDPVRPSPPVWGMRRRRGPCWDTPWYCGRCRIR